ncbi:nucleoside-diphosphate-sugar epimerase [Dyadobacter jejuensis]|uniref:Nucleoside-diphosphate-sugar epimerase n=1 Tax=Dyadobacter jejuensis TaxID=1082580 RepID=A0A316AEE9_9BACT|nr:NAD(P)-dependent oxidoreductase [Dyadobacter jejuensis]PWJ55982.1 nucleoside-diphosphate-sugar epimerase [Dyadobacter jejuensis]
MKRYLLTGGSGFIGTHLMKSLLSQGHQVINLDYKPPKLKEQQDLWIELDLCDNDSMHKTIIEYNPEYVIHLAARTDLNGKSLEEYQVNTDGVTTLLNCLEKCKNLKQVIFTSSMYVCQPGYTPRDYDDYLPHTIYGRSKVITEKLIKKRNPNYIWSIIRPTSIWGPYFGEPYNQFFNIVLSKSYFHMGSKACKKTYGYIENTIYQIESLLDKSAQEVHSKVFYLGDYEPYKIEEWANEIAAIENIKIPNIPFFIFKLAGYFGDALKIIGVTFPMTSFRLQNMTTDNVFDLSQIQRLAPNLPISREVGNKKTIEWIKSQEI